MSQTLVITTPDAVDTSKRVFPKNGKCNIKILRNNGIGKVAIWTRSGALGYTENNPIEINGGRFVKYGTVSDADLIPTDGQVINTTKLVLVVNLWNYIEVEINDQFNTAYLLLNYYSGSGTSLVGGTENNEAHIDRSVQYYTIDHLMSMYRERTVSSEIESLDTSNILNMYQTFQGAIFSKSTQDAIKNWNTANLLSIGSAFRASNFNGRLNWNTSKVTNASSAFFEAINFNQQVAHLDMSKATTLASMFRNASAFNQPLFNDVSNATDMSWFLANARSFDQNVSAMAIQKCTTMLNMFTGATSFNQDLSPWCAKFNINVNLQGFLNSTGMSIENYDRFLNALWFDIGTVRTAQWNSRTTAKVLEAANVKYSAVGAAARDALIKNGWTITDGGQAA